METRTPVRLSRLTAHLTANAPFIEPIVGFVGGLLARFADALFRRSRLRVVAIYQRGYLALLCSNLGHEGTSVNAVGLYTTLEDVPMPVRPTLPIHIPGRSEVTLLVDDPVGLGARGLSLRYRGHGITGIWYRELGGAVRRAKADAAVLHALNGGDDGSFTVS